MSKMCQQFKNICIEYKYEFDWSKGILNDSSWWRKIIPSGVACTFVEK